MPDYSEATVKVAGRFGITVADGPDTGDGPDVVWCDAGTVSFVPLNTYTKVKPLSASLGHSVVSAAIDSSGYITWSGLPYVRLVDLTSDSVNPKIADNKATHRVEFRNVTANGVPVAFETVNVRLAGDAVDPVTGVVDLVDAMPVPTAGGTPIVVGPAGRGILGFAVTAGKLMVSMSDGATEDAGELPVAPGGSDAGVGAYISTPGTAAEQAVSAKIAEAAPSVDVRTHGAVDGAANNTAPIAAAVAAAGIGGTVLFPKGVWITDPVALLDRQTVHVYGTIRLRGQNAANLPSNCGVLYAYGSTGARLAGVKVLGFGGVIDGNRRGMTNAGALTYDQEGVNFKYVDGGEISGLEVFDTIESGIDLDNSTGCIISGNTARDCYGNGFHMSNGAVDNLIQGNTAKANGFGNDRNGFDQYAGSTPQANRNRYVNNAAIGNNRNYKIDGDYAVWSSNASISGSKADEITADLDALTPRAPMRAPAAPAPFTSRLAARRSTRRLVRPSTRSVTRSRP